jgi:histidine triad (HIT) family protein
MLRGLSRDDHAPDIGRSPPGPVPEREDPMPRRSDPGGPCTFCRIVAGELPAAVVHRDEHALAFLDHTPLFWGHTLVVPVEHHELLTDLPHEQVGPYFARVQRLAGAVERAMAAQGTFVAMNNRVSQSVPHLHTHVVPRTRGDGLRGFFWPRTRYEADDQMAEVAARIAAALDP